MSHAPCHRPRRRAIQYCRGADDQSRGRGVLDTRFRGYDDWAGLQKRPFAHGSAGECPRSVIAREGGRSSIPEAAVIEPRSRGVLDPRLRGDDGVWDFNISSSLRAQSRSPDERSDIPTTLTSSRIRFAHPGNEARVRPLNSRQHAPAEQRRVRRRRKFRRPAGQFFQRIGIHHRCRARPARPAPAAPAWRW